MSWNLGGQMFPVGQIVMTPNAMGSVDLDSIAEILERHTHGDWGDLDDEDKAQNDHALNNHGRLFSQYIVRGVKVWVINEWDRSVTTVLMPEDY